MVNTERVRAERADRGTGSRGKPNASRRGPGRPPTPVPYNFRRPDKFSKDHIRSIQSIQDTFSRFAANFLSAKTRSAVHVELEHLEQSTLGEYLDQLPQPTVLYVAELEPLVGRVVIQVDLALALSVIDRMLGGPGFSGQERATGAVTEIEMLLLQDIGAGIFAELTSAWEQVEKLTAVHPEVALSPMQVQGLLPSEVALVIYHDVRLFNEQGKISICLPASTLEPVMPRLNARLLFANPRTTSGDESERDIAAQLENVALTVRVELGRTTVRVADLLALEPGDIIRLDSSVDEPVPVFVEDRHCYLGNPGVLNGYQAVRIVDRADRIEDE